METDDTLTNAYKKIFTFALTCFHMFIYMLALPMYYNMYYSLDIADQYIASWLLSHLKDFIELKKR